jgi:hypothetical protein
MSQLSLHVNPVLFSCFKSCTTSSASNRFKVFLCSIWWGKCYFYLLSRCQFSVGLRLVQFANPCVSWVGAHVKAIDRWSTIYQCIRDILGCKSRGGGVASPNKSALILNSEVFSGLHGLLIVLPLSYKAELLWKMLFLFIETTGVECNVNIEERTSGCNCLMQRIYGKECLERCSVRECHCLTAYVNWRIFM